jgi:hypothetical protein
LIVLGSLGLPHRKQQRIYAFRRTHERTMRERGLTDPLWLERLRVACHHKAASLRGHHCLDQHQRKKAKLTDRRLAQIERDIERHDRGVLKFVQELYGADDWQRVYVEGLRQLAANGMQEITPTAESSVPSSPIVAPRAVNAIPPQTVEPVVVEKKVVEEAKVVKPVTVEPPQPKIPAPPKIHDQISTYNAGAERSAPSGEPSPLPTALIPDSSENSAKPPNVGAIASGAVAQGVEQPAPSPTTEPYAPGVPPGWRAIGWDHHRNVPIVARIRPERPPIQWADNG